MLLRPPYLLREEAQMVVSPVDGCVEPSVRDAREEVVWFSVEVAAERRWGEAEGVSVG